MRASCAPSRFLACIAPMVLAACSGEPSIPEAVETEVPEGLARFEAPVDVQVSNVGTPLEDRVATLGILNKRNNLTEQIELKPGESGRVGDVIIQLSSCERTAPWEIPREEGAFVQVLIAQKDDPSDDDPEWEQVFSGWVFKNSPSLNVVEHPIYDVWIKECAMSFPGEENPVASSSSAE